MTGIFPLCKIFMGVQGGVVSLHVHTSIFKKQKKNKNNFEK